jgi:hypothetical protein
MEVRITEDDLFLLRCVITKIKDEYFEAKDYNGKKYLITRNEATKNYKIGTDTTFYATKKEEGLLFKKVVLNPLTTMEYERLLPKWRVI